MATIKSYTSLEQSKKLAEILPIESADMRYGYIAPYEFSDRKYDGGYDEIPYIKDFFKVNPNFSENEYDGELPCWSLAALLNILHSKQNDIPSLSGGGYKDGNYISNWCLDYEYDNGDYQKTFADNPVDAAFQMICWLKKNGKI